MKRNHWAAIALVSVAGVWGAAFVLMKDAIERQPLYDFLAVRFTLATLIMIAVRPQVLKAIDRELLKKGVILGLLLSGGYITQTIGLSLTTAAITGFITGLYVVLTPILGWLLLGQKTGAKVLLVGMQVPPNYGASYTQRFANLFAQVAQAEKAALVPFLLKGVADGKDPLALFQADRIHPNEAAQPTLLANVWPTLQTLLK